MRCMCVRCVCERCVYELCEVGCEGCVRVYV